MLLEFISRRIFRFGNVFISTRALVIIATNRASYLKTEKSKFFFVGGKPSLKKGGTGVGLERQDDGGVVIGQQASNGAYRPVGATVNLEKTYGPFETVPKVVAFLVIFWICTTFVSYQLTFQWQDAVEFQCGYASFNEMLLETKTVQHFSVLGEAGDMVVFFAQAFVWTRYLKSAGFDQNSSKAVKWLVYLTFVFGGYLLTNLQLLPSISYLAFGLLSYPVLFLVNFVVDSPARKRRRNYHQLRITITICTLVLQLFGLLVC